MVMDREALDLDERFVAWTIPATMAHRPWVERKVRWAVSGVGVLVALSVVWFSRRTRRSSSRMLWMTAGVKR